MLQTLMLGDAFEGLSVDGMNIKKYIFRSILLRSVAIHLPLAEIVECNRDGVAHAFYEKFSDFFHNHRL